ncbi:phosphotransferase [Actinokineospora sp.]|uniref:phosphotransferase n=1 Tax=Actinokineospora sp. TaxID=1872133 RepID=UPI00403783F9
MGTELWSSAAWRADAVSWLDACLADAGIVRTGEVEQPRVRPWATVLTAPTTAGPVWLKAAGPGTAFEAGLYEVLHDIVPDRVLAPIATDPARGRLILPDGGPTLGGLREDLLVDVLPRYGQLQRDLAPHVDRLLAAGVADMRPPILPTRFAEALSVVGDAAEPVAALGEQVTAWCARLAASPVPASIDHNDLHPENILVAADPSLVRFYDWGDSVVAHPFAAMLVPLSRLGDDAAVHRARDAYLEAFTDLAPRAELVADLELACRLGKIARALVWHRAVAAEPGDFADAPAETLLGLLADTHL